MSLRKTPKRKKTGAPSLDWIPVLMDILLGLLSNHNQFWRNTAERVFLWLKGTLTYETIQIIIKVYCVCVLCVCADSVCVLCMYAVC